MAAELHTEVSGKVDQQIQPLRLERDARAALHSAELATHMGYRGGHVQRRQRTLSCTILRSRMRILAKCEKSAVPHMLALVAINPVEQHCRLLSYQPTGDAKDV